MGDELPEKKYCRKDRNLGLRRALKDWSGLLWPSLERPLKQKEKFRENSQNPPASAGGTSKSHREDLCNSRAYTNLFRFIPVVI